jgi:hypothetical protein
MIRELSLQYPRQPTTQAPEEAKILEKAQALEESRSSEGTNVSSVVHPL